MVCTHPALWLELSDGKVASGVWPRHIVVSKKGHAGQAIDESKIAAEKNYRQPRRGGDRLPSTGGWVAKTAKQGWPISVVIIP